MKNNVTILKNFERIILFVLHMKMFIPVSKNISNIIVSKNIEILFIYKDIHCSSFNDHLFSYAVQVTKLKLVCFDDTEV